MNSITFTGNITRAPELKFLNSGKATARIGVAVNRRWQNNGGEWQEQTSFFDVVAYGKLAENAADTLDKGVRVTVTGRLEQRSWETPEGDKRSVVEVVADDVAVSLQYATAVVTKTNNESGGVSDSFAATKAKLNAVFPNAEYDDSPF